MMMSSKNQASSASNKNSSSQHIRAPSELYPVVHDLSEVEYGTDCGCGETFGSFQLSDLVLPVTVPSSSIWNALCDSPEVETPDKSKSKNSNSPHDNGNTDSPTSVSHIITNNNISDSDMRTPVKRNGLSQPALSESFEMTLSMTRDAPRPLHSLVTSRSGSADLGVQSEPFQAADLDRRQHSHQRRNLSEPRLNTSDMSCDDADDSANADTRSLQPEHQQQPKSGRKLHLRRKSRHLMNLLMVKSGSITSSTKDLSSTEASTEFSNIQSATEADEHRTFDDTYILTRQVSSTQSWFVVLYSSNI